MEKDLYTTKVLDEVRSDEEAKRRSEERQKLKAQKAERAERAKKRNKIVGKTLIIVIVALLLLLALFGRLLVQVNRLTKERNEARAKAEELSRQIEELEETLNNVTTPEYIESQARSLLRMIYPNELMYIVNGNEE